MARATHVLHVPVIRQATDYACGNTCLAAVLQYHGVFVSADEVARLAGTNATGTDHANLVRAAKRCGLAARAASGTLADLVAAIDRGLPVIVGWWSMGPRDRHFDARWTLAQRAARDCGHYSVLHGYTPARLRFMDPEVGSTALADRAFDRVWYDTDTDAYERVDRWYLVVEPRAR